MLRILIEGILSALTVAGISYCFLALWSARRFRREIAAHPASAFAPPVSILKPVKGADIDSYEAFRSHCLQEYGEYQIIFGVNDTSDPAIPLVQRLISEFPSRDIQLVVCSQVLGANRKVSNLIHLLRKARHDYLLVNDGDIHVSAGYLASVMAWFAYPKMGMVTCLYRGRPGRTLGSKLESLGISTDFAPGVLAARYMEDGLRFGLGSTLAMSRASLEKIGGFEAVADYLADDYQLGKRIADSGFKVELAPIVVETTVPPYSFRQFWQHQLRWARTMRISRPGGYRGLVLTYALPWSILLLFAAHGTWWSWLLFLAALLARVAVATSVGPLSLRDQFVFRDLWLVPIRDILALAIWVCSYASDRVNWRGEEFSLRNGQMQRVRNDLQAGSSSAAEPQRR